MSINKNALIRYRTLDKCFRNPGRRYFIENLLEACNQALYEMGGEGIARRQLYDDIRFMQSEEGWSIPLGKYKDGKKTWYRYEDTSFSIDQQPVNEMEANQLREAILVLSRFKGMPQFEWVNELILKLEQSFQLRNVEQEIIGFDSNEFLQGLEFIGDLFNAILYKKVLNISYQPFKAEKPTAQQIHPYFLKQYNNRWFLLGLNQELNKISVLALDRINSIVEVNMTYRDNELNLQEYFEDIIGVSLPEEGEVVKIELLFSKQRAPYVQTKPLHGSQKNYDEDNGLRVCIEVIPNYELDQLLLSFGEDVKVLGPPSYRERIRSKLKKALEQY